MLQSLKGLVPWWTRFLFQYVWTKFCAYCHWKQIKRILNETLKLWWSLLKTLSSLVQIHLTGCHNETFFEMDEKMSWSLFWTNYFYRSSLIYFFLDRNSVKIILVNVIFWKMSCRKIAGVQIQWKKKSIFAFQKIIGRSLYTERKM